MNTEILTPKPETDKKNIPPLQDEQKEVYPLFNYLLDPPDGIENVEAYVYEQYIGQKMAQAFQEHGFPKPEEFIAVTRTLRSVFGVEYYAEKRQWEKLNGINPSLSTENQEE